MGVAGKRRFTYPERFAVWKHNGERCWFCKEPLRLVEATVDHVLPEYLLDDPDYLKSLLNDYGLPDDFNINGFENWLPCHTHCNQTKGKKVPAFIPGNKVILDKLLDQAEAVRRTANRVSQNAAKDRVFAVVFSAMEEERLSVSDLQDLLEEFYENPAKAGLPDDMLILDSGYWIPKEQIVRISQCSCERNACVGMSGKVTCYFRSTLPMWVIDSGLFWKCFDEIVPCPRCGIRHRRGDIGRSNYCSRPFLNQELRIDETPETRSPA